MGMQVVVGRTFSQALLQESELAGQQLTPGATLDTSLQPPPTSLAAASGRHSRFLESPSWAPRRSRRAVNTCSK